MIPGFYATLPPGVATFTDLGVLHFVQAHQLAESPSRVLSWYRRRGVENGSFYTVLDNGAWELGEGRMDTLVEMAKAVRPNAVVVPDSFQDAKSTISMCKEFFEECALLAPEVMVVPQGISIAEWCGCARRLWDYVNSSDVTYKNLAHVVVGIPKVVETFQGGRAAAALWMQYARVFPGRDVHALGIWNKFSEVTELLRRGLVYSVDSTMPYAMARKEQVLYHTSYKVDMEDEWWNDIPTQDEVHLTQVNLAIAGAICHEAKSALCRM